MALADAILDLPGLCPAVTSLAGLALERDAGVRGDPAAILFLARHRSGNPTPTFFSDPLDDAALLAALDLVQRGRHPFADWRRPGLDRVWRASQSIGSFAESLAGKVGACPVSAFIAGCLAPLGWLGVAARAPEAVGGFLSAVEERKSYWQTHAWGMEHAALARRLGRAWRLPAWLSDIVGHLDWDVELVARLGVDATLIAVVQLAVRQADGLGLVVGTETPELLSRLKLTENDLTRPIVGDPPALDDPKSQPLLADVLRLTLDNRGRRDGAWVERLSGDVERLERTLSQQVADESRRLLQKKLTALAEFAAGAGHEINNPLAVISGQAQYVLKQMNAAEELLLEDATPAEILEAIQAKLTKPLQTIVGQSQRIHHVITDLMQFARPQTPRPSVAPVAKLIAEAAAAVRALADERKVRVVCPESPGLAVRVDINQVRLALVNLLRNAIEAAPADGWASIRVQREACGDLAFVVEDNGPGIPEPQREHLFDPFYSGRSAGRGRGLGLSTAWRLARQHGGDVRLDDASAGVTRFLLVLPAIDVLDNHVPAVGKRDLKLSASA